MENNNTDNNYELRVDNCQLPVPPAEAHYTVYMLKDPNGKIYIGCTGKPVEERWKKGHNYNHDQHIFKAIRAIGWENFEKKILCENLTKEGAQKLEKWFIAYYDSANPEKGYNRALGGVGKGVRMSDAVKKHISELVLKKYVEDPGYRERVRQGVHAVYENDPDYRERLSEGHRKAYENDPEIIERISGNLKMYYEKNPEKKEEISRRMKEYLSKPENRAFVDSDRHPKPVVCVETGEIYASGREVERITGLRSIHKVCHGQLATSGGYHWRFA